MTMTKLPQLAQAARFATGRRSSLVNTKATTAADPSAQSSLGPSELGGPSSVTNTTMECR
jgi:hypothetical protein